MSFPWISLRRPPMSLEDVPPGWLPVGAEGMRRRRKAMRAGTIGGLAAAAVLHLLSAGGAAAEGIGTQSPVVSGVREGHPDANREVRFALAHRLMEALGGKDQFRQSMGDFFEDEWKRMSLLMEPKWKAEGRMPTQIQIEDVRTRFRADWILLGETLAKNLESSWAESISEELLRAGVEFNESNEGRGFMQRQADLKRGVQYGLSKYGTTIEEERKTARAFHDSPIGAAYFRAKQIADLRFQESKPAVLADWKAIHQKVVESELSAR